MSNALKIGGREVQAFGDGKLSLGDLTIRLAARCPECDGANWQDDVSRLRPIEPGETETTLTCLWTCRECGYEEARVLMLKECARVEDDREPPGPEVGEPDLPAAGEGGSDQQGAG